MRPERSAGKRRWRHYETATGRRPVLEFIRELSDADKAEVLAAMKRKSVAKVPGRPGTFAAISTRSGQTASA